MLNVLVVDDDKISQKLIKYMLNEYEKQKSEGDIFSINFAEDGEKALAICGSKMPDIIFTDILMPKMNGVQLIKEVKNMDNSAYIVVITTLDDERKKESVEAGADDFLVKPLNASIFYKRLDKYLKSLNY